MITMSPSTAEQEDKADRSAEAVKVVVSNEQELTTFSDDVIVAEEAVVEEAANAVDARAEANKSDLNCIGNIISENGKVFFCRLNEIWTKDEGEGKL